MQNKNGVSDVLLMKVMLHQQQLATLVSCKKVVPSITSNG